MRKEKKMVKTWPSLDCAGVHPQTPHPVPQPALRPPGVWPGVPRVQVPGWQHGATGWASSSLQVRHSLDQLLFKSEKLVGMRRDPGLGPGGHVPYFRLPDAAVAGSFHFLRR